MHLIDLRAVASRSPWPAAATASRRTAPGRAAAGRHRGQGGDDNVRPFLLHRPGRSDLKVDLRARVDGFLEKRLFIEGADVKEGELLFVIEKGLYQAAVEEAKAGVETAEATLKLADLELTRQPELVQRSVAAQARLDDASAKQGEARGNLLAQKAALERAELQLTYTDIRAPITGRIGRANISVGNFVGPQSGSLATIVSQDPIYVSFPVTQREILAYRAEQTSPAAPPRSSSICSSPTAAAMRTPARSTSSTSRSIRGPTRSWCARSSPIPTASW